MAIRTLIISVLALSLLGLGLNALAQDALDTPPPPIHLYGAPVMDCDGHITFYTGIMEAVALGKLADKAVEAPAKATTKKASPFKVGTYRAVFKEVGTGPEKEYVMGLIDPETGTPMLEFKGQMSQGVITGKIQNARIFAEGNIDTQLMDLQHKFVADLFRLFRGQEGSLDVSVGHLLQVDYSPVQSKVGNIAGAGMKAQVQVAEKTTLTIRIVGGPGVSAVQGKDPKLSGGGMLVLEIQ